ETGRAVDLALPPKGAKRTRFVNALKPYGLAEDVRFDANHFDHWSSTDNRALNVRAFQSLWTRNYPNDPIPTTGTYDAATQQRVLASPVDGFAIGACQVDPAQ